MGDNLLHVSDAEFEEKVLKSELPVVVDFWAPWWVCLNRFGRLPTMAEPRWAP